MTTPSRIDDARRKLRFARYAIASAAAASFGVFVVAAKASHPGTASHSSQTQATSTSTASTFSFGGSSIQSAPESGAPSVESAGS